MDATSESRASADDLKVIRTFHTGITCQDLDYTIGFFRDVLGFELIDRSPRKPENQAFVSGVPGADVEIAYMRRPDYNVELLQFKGPEGREHYRPRMVDIGHFHVSMVVNDVDAAVARAKAYDPEIVTLSPRPLEVDNGPNKGNRIIFVKLRDGQLIEFTTRKGES